MVITFETIRDIQRSEKENKSLTKLQDGIFAEIAEYLKRKSERKEDFLEVENIKNIIRDIIDRREHKIVEMAIMYVRSGIIPNNMTKEEEEFFSSLVKTIKEFRDSYYSNIISGSVKQEEIKDIAEKPEEPKKDAIQITEDIPEFVFNNKVYMLKKDEIASLPQDLEEFLVKKGVAKRI